MLPGLLLLKPTFSHRFSEPALLSWGTRPWCQKNTDWSFCLAAPDIYSVSPLLESHTWKSLLGKIPFEKDLRVRLRVSHRLPDILSNVTLLLEDHVLHSQGQPTNLWSQVLNRSQAPLWHMTAKDMFHTLQEVHWSALTKLGNQRDMSSTFPFVRRSQSSVPSEQVLVIKSSSTKTFLFPWNGCGPRVVRLSF